MSQWIVETSFSRTLVTAAGLEHISGSAAMTEELKRAVETFYEPNLENFDGNFESDPVWHQADFLAELVGGTAVVYVPPRPPDPGAVF